MPCQQCLGIEAQFNDRVAKRELKRFNRSGPKPQTRMLIDEMRRIGIAGRTVLDVGGGIGAIQHVCANEGAVAITSVEASPAYLATAQEEAERRGYENLVTYVRGDFAELAPQLEPADLVTMDRVICCYPDLEALLRPAADHTRMCLGLVFPRENWWIKAGARAANFLLRVGGSKFQAFVHPHAEVETCARQAGLALGYSAYKGLWRVAVFIRT